MTKCSLLAVALLACCIGCAGRPATDSEQVEIGRAVAEYEHAIDYTGARVTLVTTQPTTRIREIAASPVAMSAMTQEPGGERQPRFMIRKATVRDDRATCEYDISYPLSQFPYSPRRAELAFAGGRWTVLRAQSDQPWWWEVANQTVGAK